MSPLDLCVIILDKGAIDNHLPNKVLVTLNSISKMVPVEDQPQYSQLNHDQDIEYISTEV